MENKVQLWSKVFIVFVPQHFQKVTIMLLTVVWFTNNSAVRPGPIMLFKLPIMLLSNASNFPCCVPIMLHCAYCAPLCSIYNFIKVLFPENLNIYLFLTVCKHLSWKTHLQFVKQSDCSNRVYRSVSMEFWKVLFVGCVHKKCWQNC